MNPFFTESTLALKYPPFDLIKEDHYLPAFERGMAEQKAEIEAIAQNPEPASFENTMIALEKSGQLLSRVSRVFGGLASAHTNDRLEAIRTEVTPLLSAHRDSILLNDNLFNRIETLYLQMDLLDLDPEGLRLIKKYYQDFERAGAKLSEEEKEKLKTLNTELAQLQTKFTQHVLKEVNALAVVVEDEEDLAGLSNQALTAAAKQAEEEGHEGKYLIPLANTSIQPVLASLENRALRERIFKTSLSRGNRGGEFDNRDILAAIVRLRAERAQLLGFDNHAAIRLDSQTAKTPQAVQELLHKLTPPAVANLERETQALQALIDEGEASFELAPWDWAFYAERLRRKQFELDEDAMKPYFELDNTLQKGAFYAANQLFGLTFNVREDLPTFHPDVRVYEVIDENQSLLALFLFDPYARPSKRGGAWMNTYVSQSRLLAQKAVVANTLNIPKPPDHEPTLLTFNEVITLFHEFGHALHGLFSNVTFPYFSGTIVPRDFVEFPSQAFEMWATWPEVLQHYAIHHETGQPMPTEMIDKVLASQQFNQGYATTEYLAASWLDQALHLLTPEEVPAGDDLLAFEQAVLQKAGIPSWAPPRYRSTYFSHIIGGYSAGYYAYIWSEVMDADSVEWFKENGGLTRENGAHYRSKVLSRGGSIEPMAIYTAFRGAEPAIEPLLERRGLAQA